MQEKDAKIKEYEAVEQFIMHCFHIGDHFNAVEAHYREGKIINGKWANVTEGDNGTTIYTYDTDERGRAFFTTRTYDKDGELVDDEEKKEDEEEEEHEEDNKEADEVVTSQPDSKHDERRRKFCAIVHELLKEQQKEDEEKLKRLILSASVIKNRYKDWAAETWTI